jgi:hemolysin activation/secretion protein
LRFGRAEFAWGPSWRYLDSQSHHTALSSQISTSEHHLIGLLVSYRSWRVHRSVQGNLSLEYVQSSPDVLERPGVLRISLPDSAWLANLNLQAVRQINPDWQWHVRGGAQSSFGLRLYPALTGALDGQYRVRGYQEGVHTGDELVWISLEWHRSLFMRSDLVQRSDQQHEAFGFIDAGWLEEHPLKWSSNRPVVSELVPLLFPHGQRTLASVGLGYRWAWQDQLEIKVMLAQALKADDYRTDQGDVQLHLSLRWQPDLPFTRRRD